MLCPLADLRLNWWTEVFSLTLALSRWEREFVLGFLGCFSQKPEVIGSKNYRGRPMTSVPCTGVDAPAPPPTYWAFASGINSRS